MFSTPELQDWATWQIALVLFSATLMLLNLRELFMTYCWTHDYMGYLPNYLGRLQGEGRWLNYIFFQTLQTLPAHLLLLIRFLCAFSFLYIVSYLYTTSIKLSIFFALTSLQIFSIIAESMEPAYTVPGYVVLLLSAVYLRDRADRNLLLFFPVTGIFLFGSVSQIYFLIPLLFIRQLEKSTNKFKAMIKLLILWIVGYVFGYLFANLIVYMKFGTAILVAEWRRPNYLNSLGALVENLNRVAHHCHNYFQMLIDTYFFVPTLAVAVCLLVYRRSYIGLVMCAFVTLSVFSNTLVGGIIIQMRTTLPFYSGLLLVVLLPVTKYRSYRYFCPAIMTLLTVSFFTLNYQELSWYRHLTNYYRDAIERQLSLRPYQVSQFVFHTPHGYHDKPTKPLLRLDHNLNRKHMFTPRRSSPYRVIPAFRSLGYWTKIKYKMNDHEYVVPPTEPFIIKSSSDSSIVHVYF